MTFDITQAETAIREAILEEQIKKLSLNKGDIIIAHQDLKEALVHLRLKLDFKVPVIFTDDLSKIDKESFSEVRKEIGG